MPHSPMRRLNQLEAQNLWKASPKALQDAWGNYWQSDFTGWDEIRAFPFPVNLTDGDTIMPSPRASDFEGKIIDTTGMPRRTLIAIAKAIAPYSASWCHNSDCDSCEPAARIAIDTHNAAIRSRSRQPTNDTPEGRAIYARIAGTDRYTDGRTDYPCANCNIHMHIDAITWVIGRRHPIGDPFCRRCLAAETFYSEIEDRYVSVGHGVAIADRALSRISRHWAIANSTQCNRCAGWFMEWEAHLQTGCPTTIPDDGRPVFSYHGTTPIQTHGWPKVTPKDSLCFGIELEMEHIRRDDSEGQALLAALLGSKVGYRNDPIIKGRYVLERDGSLNASGVELITNPYTLDFHLNDFGWQALLDKVKGKAKSGKNTSHCGMHVHANRKAISALNLGKTMVFINSPANADLVWQIAQRNSSYARLMKKKITNGNVGLTDKYEAVHVGMQTVEFRLFRGNLRPERVLKNIEFCHSILTYCKDASMKLVETPDDYLAWLAKRRPQYRNLTNFLGMKIPMTDESAEE